MYIKAKIKMFCMKNFEIFNLKNPPKSIASFGQNI